MVLGSQLKVGVTTAHLGPHDLGPDPGSGMEKVLVKACRICFLCECLLNVSNLKMRSSRTGSCPLQWPAEHRAHGTLSSLL